MAISEAARNDLYTGLRDVIGPQRAETLMSAILLYNLDEVATKGDVTTLGTELRAEFKGDIARLRTDVAELRAEVKGDIAENRAEVKDDIAELRAEVKGDIAELRAGVKDDIAELRRDIDRLQRSMFSSMFMLFVAIIGAIASVAVLV